MAAKSIDAYVVVIPWFYLTENIVALDSNSSFSLSLESHIQTLSTNTIEAGTNVSGVLHVPSLDQWDPCGNLSKQYIPDFSMGEYGFASTIAYAPWFSAKCTRSYLESASKDGSRAFIFYIPDDATSTPPPSSDPYWDLDDGGQWESQSPFPVYAIPGFFGAAIMEQMALYSGAIDEVPNGHRLSEQYNSRDYVRLSVTVATRAPRTRPSVWVYLLIAFGTLLGVILLTSILMHCWYRRRRQELRHMIANGEVDLEALGVKRVKLKQVALDSLPLFVYVASEQDRQTFQSQAPLALDGIQERSGQQPETPWIQVSQINDISSSIAGGNLGLPRDPLQDSGSEQPFINNLPHDQLSFAQDTCPICLDDFVSHEAIVRQLPCAHIYHPECIDPFLKAVNSFCPMCKAKILPRGYYPSEVTNEMVRRERSIRRMRERVTTENADEAGTLSGGPSVAGRWMSSIRPKFRRRNAEARRSTSNAPPTDSVEMTGVGDLMSAPLDLVRPQRRSPNVSRRDWARQRAIALLGHQSVADDHERGNQAVRPWWRPSFSNIFPGFP